MCENLSEITTSAYNLSVGNYAFASCNNLQSINFSSGLNFCFTTRVGSFAFESCSALSNLFLGGCLYIGDGAFRDCTNLSKIYLLSSKCTLVTSRTFNNTNIQTIYVPSKYLASYKAATN